MSDPPAFGPRGYLPERAAKRARKIVLREQMGLGWPLAALAAAVLVAVVGVTYLARAGPPGEPLRAAGPLAEVAAGTAGVVAVDGGGDLLVVRAGGRVRTFAPPGAAVRWCEDSSRLEASDGRVWTLDGILVGGSGNGLRAVPSSVYRDTVYADLTGPGRDLPADPRGERPACREETGRLHDSSAGLRVPRSRRAGSRWCRRGTRAGSRPPRRPRRDVPA